MMPAMTMPMSAATMTGAMPGGMMMPSMMGMMPNMMGMMPNMMMPSMMGMMPNMMMPGMMGMMPNMMMPGMMGMMPGAGAMPGMMPMMGMMPGVAPMIARMTMELGKEGMTFKLMPMEGTTVEAMRERAEAMTKMMAQGQPMLMMCGGMPMMACVATSTK